MKEEQVILVDQHDKMIGITGKLEAHVLGKLHRAFSIFIFNSRGELLLQQRAFQKYHSGGKWTNTCCSHPRPGENILDAANRRLKEEMGFTCKVESVFTFCYYADMDNDLIENEFDHVLFGISDQLPLPFSEEVAGFKYISMDELAMEIQLHPQIFTEWLKECFGRVLSHHHKIFQL
ncbi:isopentenyl-diphosphate Delta-isomerase [Mucilaginibacter flavus]|uniref:isopentenyl-diphosphate Delta-isomerase n=1 Tax=Mucilaginibacter flavus TaxID=931504 RepID=UPI0025B5BC52|nr:isopentenyl-diphosphate Delta-isomerase [Mucilaginibacter flavus]MDN3584576.1 isopentenyl-diphosphate Delta-isomerase [Mucilaginibacter flavus]